jgi:hypothetical protein
MSLRLKTLAVFDPDSFVYDPDTAGIKRRRSARYSRPIMIRLTYKTTFIGLHRCRWISLLSLMKFRIQWLLDLNLDVAHCVNWG